MQNYDDTIAAISTPPGEGGIGIVRLSGSEAIGIVSRLFVSNRQHDLHSRRRVYYGRICDPQSVPLDEVLVHVMRAPHSYTREDVVEINCHGGAGPLNAVLEAVLAGGARLARPGEFTQRAFLNGRIDLVQAEAVIDQIRARTRAGLRAAQAAVDGALSQALYRLRQSLADALAHIEAAVDFPEEDLPDLLTPALITRLRETQRQMEELLATSDAGCLYREGASVAIAGRPNVGKSSLFNALLRERRAIVSVHAGTTRDRIEEYVTIGGIPVKLVDTAGLRETADEVEQIGVDVARAALESAHAVLFVVDASQSLEADDRKLAAELQALETPVILVRNKIDLARGTTGPNLPLEAVAACDVSAVTGAGLPELESALASLLLGGVSIDAGQAMLTRLHQKDSLRRAHEALGRLFTHLEMSPEFLAIDLRDSLQALGEITGETTPDELLETIFSSFCIGK